jgi:DNA-binding transcriptional regulator YdaS (Cro superfamily)
VVVMTSRRRGRPPRGNEQLLRVGGNRNPVYRAVMLLGGLNATAERLGVRRWSVWLWIRERHVAKTRYALALARLTGVPIESLVPAKMVVGRRSRRASAAE